ncbi:unnamed protein product [Cuscuta epithymum]|uniref:Uncharacterized protein n=1 Tax=Cuscuta epithymum TaxID=186058 RepID=A0AAV0CY31_9ASTE|nr:unnamed protein product [Cuscuta epithymum]CAH9129036.1 unnamed protein product [Cuscuta epithymum]
MYYRSPFQLHRLRVVLSMIHFLSLGLPQGKSLVSIVRYRLTPRNVAGFWPSVFNFGIENSEGEATKEADEVFGSDWQFRGVLTEEPKRRSSAQSDKRPVKEE